MSENSKVIVDDKYEIEKQIGRGGFGNIYLVKNIKDDKNYALKLLILERVSKGDINLFENEKNILKRLSELDNNNKYVSKLIDYGKGNVKKKDKIVDQNNLRQYLVLNYFEKGNLCYYMKNKKDGFEEIHAKILFKKILEGIQFCHKNNICHLDIKTENILLDKDFNPIIIDFGFSAECKNSIIEIDGGRGSRLYTAPEMISNQNNLILNGIKADIYSLGILLFNLVTGNYPFKIATRKDDFYKYIIKKNYELFWTLIEGNKTNKNLSKDFKDLFVIMVANKPKERLSIEEILGSKWMKELDNLGKDEYEKKENELREKFLELENNIIVDNNEEIKVVPKKDNNNENPKKSASDTKTYYNSNISLKKFDRNEFANHNVKIIGDFNAIEFMCTLINIIGNGNDCEQISFSKENLSFRATFKLKEENEIKIEEENEKDEENGEDEESEESEENANNYERNCIINISLVELKKGEYYIQFLKEKGELEYYYEKFLKIKNIIKKIEA